LVLGENENVRKAFNEINKLLDGKQKSFKEGFKILKAVLGTAGGLSIIYSRLLFTGVGLGVLAQMKLFLYGPPKMKVAVFALLGVILIALATIKMSEEDIMNVCVSTAYKLLDGHKP
jgi:hypothetical protein